MRAVLALEDGTRFEGSAFGATGEAGGEVVFNTSMTGYQEILTDPSYAGQIVTMTAPEIGNYGISQEDVESRRPAVAGFVVRDMSPIASNWRSSATLDRYLQSRGVVGISGVDTRALTRRLRSSGVMRGVIASGDTSAAEAVEKARSLPRMEGADLVRGVTCAERFDWPAPADEASRVTPAMFGIEPESRSSRQLRVAAYDFGVKWNLLRRLAAYGCDVRVFPATAAASELLAFSPDGVFLSNGPGDPAALDYAIENVRELLAAGVPMFGVCLGHQLLALAAGARTYKLKFGHRGANHPVSRLREGRVEITSQNHGFAVDAKTVPPQLEVTHVNLYDRTVEGLRHTSRPAFSVQYHPEASPGPHDSDYLFGSFMELMGR